MFQLDRSAMHSTDPYLIATENGKDEELSPKKKKHLLVLFAVFIATSISTADSGVQRAISGTDVEYERKGNSTFDISEQQLSESSLFSGLLQDSANHLIRLPRGLPKPPSHRKSKKEDNCQTDEHLEAVCSKLAKLEPSNKEADKAAKQHRDELEDICWENDSPGCYPIPRIVHLSQMCRVLPHGPDYSRLRTILYQCPSLSCCKLMQRCQTKNSTEIYRTFTLLNGTSRMTTTIAFQNDTECECREDRNEEDITKTGKCPIKCPVPYVKVKEKHKCECTCSGKSESACVRIRQGEVALQESARRCIERKNCRLPSCSSGLTFDLQTGLCKKVNV